MGLGKAADQGGDIFDRVEAGGDARHHGGLVNLQAHGPEIGHTVQGGGRQGEVDAVVDGEELVRVKAPGDEQIHHGVGDADAVIQPPQCEGIDGAVGDAGEGSAQIIQAVVGVDGGDHRQAGGFAQKGAHHIPAGTVTVDEIVAALPDFLLEQAEGAEHIAVGIDLSGDAQLPRLLGEGSLHEADHVHLDGPGQVLEQGEHMGFGAAAVAAADEMNDFHAEGLQKVLVTQTKILYNSSVRRSNKKRTTSLRRKTNGGIP